MDISYLVTQAVSLNRHIKQQNANDDNWQDSEHKSIVSALDDTLVAFYELFHYSPFKNSVTSRDILWD